MWPLDLWIGNSKDDSLFLWQKNANMPSWSRDGDTLFYLAAGKDQDTAGLNLYKSSIDLERNALDDAELVAPQMGIPYLTQPIEEAINDWLIAFDAQGMPVAIKLPEGKEQIALTQLDGVARRTFDERTSFSLSSDGRFLALIAFNQSVDLIDLQTMAVVGEIPYPIANFN